MEECYSFICLVTIEIVYYRDCYSMAIVATSTSADVMSLGATCLVPYLPLPGLLWLPLLFQAEVLVLFSLLPDSAWRESPQHATWLEPAGC